MKLLLINPPNNFFDVFELAPPISLLSLASALEQEDIDIEILDCNLKGISEHEFVQENFYLKTLKIIEEKSPDVVGLTSMVVNSHVALELARLVKERMPETSIVLGGTHFSSIAEEVLSFYPWVDYVITGEGEIPFRNLMSAIRKGSLNSNNALANVALRDGDQILLSQEKKPFADLGELRFPAYSLVKIEDYFKLNPERVLDYEPGRGCVYKCSFCYSPVHYGPGGQSKTIDHILSDMERLQNLGARHLFFVQDNFLNNAPLAKEICRAIAGAGFDLTWNCYTTLPQMSEEMIQLLGAAGCVNAFTGIDAVNEAYQNAFLKKFYKGWGPLERTLKCCVDNNVTPTCAFMVENQSTGTDNLERTLVTALFAKCNGASVRLNTLTLYNGTPSSLGIADQTLTYSELKPRLLLDCPDIVQENEYAHARPHLFPFHNTFLKPEVWHSFTIGMHITYTLFNTFPMTLYRYVTEDHGSIWAIVDLLANKFDNLTGIHPDYRRSMERAEFMKWFEDQNSLQQITKDAFTLEAAEFEAFYGDSEKRLKIQPTPDAPHQDFVVRGHRLAKIGHDVGDLHRFDLGSKPMQTETRRLLLTRNGRSLNYTDVDESVFSTLKALDQSHSEFAEVDVGVFETLKAVGLVCEATCEA